MTKENGRIKFEFQDELVMCYLAAEFVNNLLGVPDIPRSFILQLRGETLLYPIMSMKSVAFGIISDPKIVLCQKICQ